MKIAKNPAGFSESAAETMLKPALENYIFMNNAKN
jgi:hypothetical protein